MPSATVVFVTVVAAFNSPCSMFLNTPNCSHQFVAFDGTIHGPLVQHRFLGSMGCVVIWGPSRNCAEICGDCERGLDPAVVIPPEASSTPLISLESLAAAGYLKKTCTGRFDLAEWPMSRRVRRAASIAAAPAQAKRPRAVERRSGPPPCSVLLRMSTCRATSLRVLNG